MACEALIIYTDTPFVVLAMPFQYPMAETPLWYYGTNVGQAGTPDLVALLKSKYPQFTYSQMYKRNNCCVVIVDGTEDSVNLQWKNFWSRSASGVKQYLSANSRAFYFYGALTYEEAMAQATARMNVRSFHNRGEESWTQVQRDTYNKTVMHFDECKRGEYRADFRYATISPQIKLDAKNIYKWAYVLG